jgi:integrase
VTWKNPQPAPRGIRIYTDAEIKKLAGELGTTYGPMIRFAAATGLRPDEWARLERRDLDKRRRVLSVRGTKTARARREVPLTRTALEAVDAPPARIDTPHLFANAEGGPLNLNGFRRREWGPAVDAAGVAKPARLYDLRSTFATNALAHGVTESSGRQ